MLLVAFAAACGSPTNPDAGDGAPTDRPATPDVPRDSVDVATDTPAPPDATDVPDATADVPGDILADVRGDAPDDATADVTGDAPADGASDGGDGGVMRGTGFVDMRLVPEADGGARSLAAANFGYGETLTPGCTRTTMGECTTIRCTRGGDAGTPDAGPPPVVHAGAIDLANRTTPTRPMLTLTPSAAGVYDVPMVAGGLWAMGESVGVRAAGMSGGVPTFDQTVRGPGSMTLTAPTTPAAATPWMVDRTGPLRITWTGDMGGEVRASLVAALTSGGVTNSTSITCYFPAAPGTATVPAALMMTLPATGTGSYSFFAAGHTNVTAGVFEVELRALLPMLPGAGVGATAGTLQAN